MRRLWISLFALTFAGLTVPDGAAAQIQECARILDDGIRDTYDAQTFSSYESALQQLLAMSDEQLRSARSSGDFGFSVPIPFGEAFASLAFGSSDSRERVQSLRSTYRQSGFSAIRRSDYVWLTQRVVNQAIPNAWLRCIELTVDRRPQGLTIEVDDDVARRFGLTLQWQQASAAEAAPRISGIYTEGVQLAGGNNLTTGMTLNNLQRYLQPFERTDSAEAIIALYFDNHDDLFLRLPSIVPATTEASLQGTWVLAGIAPGTRILACMSCPLGPSIHVDNQPGTWVNPVMAGRAIQVSTVRVAFLPDGRGAIQLGGTVASADGPPRDPMPFPPGAFTGPFQSREETMWFDYALAGETLRFTPRVLATPWGPPSTEEPETAELDYQFLANGVLMVRVAGVPLFLMRPEQLGPD